MVHKITRDDIFGINNGTAGLTYPEVTDEMILNLFETESYSEEEKTNASFLITQKIPNSKALYERIDDLFAEKGGAPAFIRNIRGKLGLLSDSKDF